MLYAHFLSKDIIIPLGILIYRCCCAFSWLPATNALAHHPSPHTAYLRRGKSTSTLPFSPCAQNSSTFCAAAHLRKGGRSKSRRSEEGDEGQLPCNASHCASLYPLNTLKNMGRSRRARRVSYNFVTCTPRYHTAHYVPRTPRTLTHVHARGAPRLAPPPLSGPAAACRTTAHASPPSPPPPPLPRVLFPPLLRPHIFRAGGRDMPAR